VDVLNYILAGFTLASILGTIAASFYGVRSRTIITTLRESNDAYKERNAQLEQQLKQITESYAADIAELKGKVATLEKIKTPPLEPMMQLIIKNHTEVMKAIKEDHES